VALVVDTVHPHIEVTARLTLVLFGIKANRAFAVVEARGFLGEPVEPDRQEISVFVFEE